LPKLVCEKALIRELFQNLIDNAIKYTAGPTVDIEIGRDAGANSLPTFFVKDFGVGIHDEDRVRVFEPLKRADHHKLNDKGVGLGMALVKKIVERHGGTIWFDSRIAEGTTFYFSLREHS
jgi:signal transduction histidine kinase